MEEPDSLQEHRKYIDRIDRTIVALLAERMRQGLAAGDLKHRQHWPTRSPEREAEVLAQVRAAASTPLSATSAARIFALIIKETTAVQEESRDAERSC
jgi:chorismate mutase